MGIERYTPNFKASRRRPCLPWTIINFISFFFFKMYQLRINNYEYRMGSLIPWFIRMLLCFVCCFFLLFFPTTLFSHLYHFLLFLSTSSLLLLSFVSCIIMRRLTTHKQQQYNNGKRVKSERGAIIIKPTTRQQHRFHSFSDSILQSMKLLHITFYSSCRILLHQWL